jgi:hypothetical protein
MAPVIIPQCSDEFPFVLLPVRLETKFQQSASGTELRVRFYPDAISIAATPAPVTDNERVLGQAYWTARTASRQAPNDAALQRSYVGAWNVLAARAGAYRAGFIIRDTAPLNPNAASKDLQFAQPPAPPVTPPSGSQAAGLPDNFLVVAYFLDPTTRVQSEVARAVGAPIPPDLPLGPDPNQASLSRDPASGRLVVPDSLRWLVDFDAAVKVGMALRMPVPAPFDTRGFDRLVALGVRTKATFPDGSAILEQLFSNHRDSDGFALVPAGTPTNNTDSVSSGWQPPSAQTQDLFAIEDNPPDLTPKDAPLGTLDGWMFADLLGLSSEFVRRLPGAAATDIAEGLTFNRAATPGTVGDFVREYLKGLVDTPTADALHDFFTAWVSGRSSFPGFRAGKQPYGIVLTSAWKLWPTAVPVPSAATPSDIVQRIHALIAIHRPRWEALADRAPHAAQPTTDPFQRLLGILGLLASSTSYVSRKAVSDAYIRQRLTFAGAQAPATQAWLNALAQSRTGSLSGIDFPPAPGPTDPLLAFIVFLGQTDEWQLPIIDQDPKVPLSETAQITPYDSAHNYLQWLSSASPDDISNQRFTDALGNIVPAPTALLYVVLRHAMLAALETSSMEMARLQGQALFDVADRDPLIANIGDQQNVLRKDYLDLDASRLGLGAPRETLVDWVSNAALATSASNFVPVQRVAEVQKALTALASLPTARLERLLAEHVDLCSYRLDAWITGFYGYQLAALRQRSDVRGLYLGAYSWVENLRPPTGQPQPVPVNTLPPLLQAAVTSNVFEDPANAGYIHAPSVMQATTAAVLRNGYLSHANATQPLPFAVNLSSSRMRAALDLMDGVRNGQPLGALLGYQFERGLHEGYPGVELDTSIAAFRDQFPLVAGRLTELPTGTSAEVVEARNVVDGMALLDAVSKLPYPYGVSGLPAPPSPAATAIVSEIGHLQDAIDAVSDLLLSESVYQAVQGNTARLQGALQSLTSPEAPPEPDILRTPRSGRLLTFRIGLTLDPDASAGWSPALSPRAQANAPLNHWLAEHLPAANQIQWTVRRPGMEPETHSAAELGFEPLDLVLMSADQLGDQSSELERFLIGQYRWKHSIPDSLKTVVASSTPISDPEHSLVFDFDSASAGAASLGSVQPLLVRWRRLITQTRAMHAGDWRRTRTAQGTDAEDPTGSASGDPRLIQFADLTARIDAATQALAAASQRVQSASEALAAMTASMETDPSVLNNPALPATVDALRTALFAIELFGMPEAAASPSPLMSVSLISGLLSQAQLVLQIAADRSGRAVPLRQTTFPDPLPTSEPARTIELARRNDVLRQNYAAAAKAVFGPAFVIIPLYQLQADQRAEVQQAIAQPPIADSLAVQEWLSSVSRVRPRVADNLIAAAAARWLGVLMEDPAVLQLPVQAGVSWIGGRVTSPLPLNDWLSVVLWNSASLPKPLQSGLMLDDWTETIPAPRETTGVAFQYNRPNATAPQAILFAVPAQQLGHWSWDELLDSVHEALDLAKIRAVEPDALIGRGPEWRPPEGDYFQVLPAILMEMTRTRFASTDLTNINTATIKANS